MQVNKTCNMKVNCKFKGSSAYAILHAVLVVNKKETPYTKKIETSL